MFDYSILEVVRLCGLETVGSPSRKGEQKVKCPFVSGKTFDVNVTTSTYKCWHDCTGCSGNGKGGVLALYRMFHSECETNKDAAKQIHSALYGDLKTGSKDYEARKAQIIKPQKEVQKTKYASPDEIDGAYRVLLSLLPLKEKHKSNLLSRGMSAKGIEDGLYRSIPENKEEMYALMQKLNDMNIKLDGVPGFYKKGNSYRISLPGLYDKNTKTFFYGSGFFVPSFGRNGKIFSMQIRMDDTYLSRFPAKQAKRRRYIWFTSSGYDSGCQAINRATYGVVDGTPRNTGNVVYVTEGALKAQVAHDIDHKHRQFCAISGIANSEAFRKFVRTQKKAGCKILVDAFDMDRNEKDTVKNAIDKLYAIAEEEGLPLQPFAWDERFKGIDDYLLHCRDERIQQQIIMEICKTA